jgi:hypothetical protein
MTEAKRGEPEDRELAGWQAEWQALGGQAGLASTLVARAARDGKRMRLAAAKKIFGAAVSTSIAVWLLARSGGQVEILAVAVLVLLFNGAWVTNFFTMRADLFSPSAAGVSEYVVLTRRRLEAEQRWARLARRWTAGMCALIFPWAVWVFIAYRDAYAAAPWRGVVGFGTATVIFVAVYLWAARREREIRAEAEAFERNIADVALT